MGDQQISRMRGHREARHFLVLFFLCMMYCLAIYPFRDEASLVAVAVIVLLAFAAIGLHLAKRVALTGTGSLKLPVALPGFVFIVGGAAFDIGATIYHSPSLDRESNPVARALLDSGYSVPIVYAVATVGQALYVSLLCMMWVGLLKHWPALVGSLSGGQSITAFVKAAAGGRRLTWRQFLFPLRVSDLPDALYLFWILASIEIAGSLDRWYLGLEWCGYCYGWREMVIGLSILAGPAVYLICLWRASRLTVS